MHERCAQPRSPLHRRSTAPFLLSFLIAAPLFGTPPSLGRASFDTRVEPRIFSDVSAPVRGKLQAAFGIALRSLSQQASCGVLFDGLEKSGLDALRLSVYVPVKRGIETSICERGVVAYTEVGSRVTRVCPAFVGLGDRRAAFTLIHEALHHAGLGERPADPDADSSDEITRAVIRACR